MALRYILINIMLALPVVRNRAMIALTTIAVLLRFKKLQEPLIIAVAALIGIILKLVIHI
ncbi:MAG TPA: hypothetical protein VIQ51_04075 [Chryseosolibacter sp.]